MKKGILAVVLLSMAMLTGCSLEQKVTINSDYSSDVVMDCYTTQADEDAVMESMREMGAEEDATFQELMEGSGFAYVGAKQIDGIINNLYRITGKNTAEDTKSMFLELTKQKAVYNVASQMETQTQQMSGSASADYSDMNFFRLTITYPFKVAKTNGQLQEDGRTVVYDIIDMSKNKEARAYALSASALSKSNSVTIKGIKNKKAYRKAVTVKATSKGVITSFKVNGKEQSVNSYYAKKNGKYKLEIKTASGKKITRTFYVDKKKPTTNIKNKK